MTLEKTAVAPNLLRFDVRTKPKRSSGGVRLDYRLGEGVDYLFLNVANGALYNRDGLLVGTTTFDPREEWRHHEREVNAARQQAFMQLRAADRELDGLVYESYEEFSKYSLYLAMSASAYEDAGARVPGQLASNLRHADRVVVQTDVLADRALDERRLSRSQLFTFVDRQGETRPVQGVLHTMPTRALVAQLPPSMRPLNISAGR